MFEQGMASLQRFIARRGRFSAFKGKGPWITPEETKDRGGKNRAFGRPCSCPLPKKRFFWRKRREWRVCVYPPKTRVLLLKPEKNHENDESGRCHIQGRAWFTNAGFFLFLFFCRGHLGPKWPKESEMSSGDLSALGVQRVETESKKKSN